MTQQAHLRTIFEHYLKTQWFGAQEIENYQAQLLARIVRHAHDTSPFYRERLKPLIAGRRTIDLAHWNAVPILTREELKLNEMDTISRAIPPEHGKFYRRSSSGTTREPVTVTATSLAGKVRKAVAWRTHTWHNIDWSKHSGVMMRDPGVAFWPEGSRDSSPWGPPWIVPDGPPCFIIPSRTPIDRLTEWAARNKLRYLTGLPITLAAIAEEPAARNLSVETCLSFGMRVKPEHRSAVKNAFGAKIVELYGSEECGPLAQACEAGSLHVMVELVRLEIVDDEGNPCPPGTTGHVLVTVFHNAAQPVIRYAIGDVASFGGPCSCGAAATRSSRAYRAVCAICFAAPMDRVSWPTPSTICSPKAWE